MKIPLTLAFLSICLTSNGYPRSVTEEISRGQQAVEEAEGDNVEVESGWKFQQEEKELERLQELIMQSLQHNRSRVWGQGGLPLSLASRVTSTQMTFLDLVHLYLPKLSERQSKQCRRDLIAIYTSVVYLEILLQKKEFWPLQLIDSWGKLGDGLLLGNLKQLGFFKECLDIRVQQPLPDHQEPQTSPLHYLHTLRNQMLTDTETVHETDTQRLVTDHPDSESFRNHFLFPPANFSGQYCLVSYRSADEIQVHSPPLRTPTLSFLSNATLSFMAYGTCIPSTCTTDDLKATVNEVLQREGLEVSILDCQVKEYHHPLQASETTGIVILTVLSLLLIYGSLFDLITLMENKQHLKKGPLRYLLVFSIQSNLKKIMNMENRKLPGVIPCINGIRFISISWVVLGHQYAYSMQVTQNIADLPELSKPFYAQMVTNADLSVDTFFTLSGLLVTLGLFGMIEKTGRFSPPFYLLHRVLRLWPPLALSVVLVATISGLLVSGPFAEEYWSSVVKGCRDFWWVDISLITNLIFPYLDKIPRETGEAASCLPHTWYLGVDTQLYLIMPIILLPLIRWPRQGAAWLGVWTIASIVIPSAITGAYNLWPASMMVIDPEASLQYNYKVYLMPWCRAGPYLAGAWAGYIMHLSRKRPSIARLRLWQVALGWAVAVGAGLAVLFGIAPYNFVGLPSDVPQMSTASAVMYGGAHRAVWGVVVSWVILACAWGYGGPVASILEHPFWQPLSRLSYCIYLTSLPVQYVVLFSTKRTTYFSPYNKMQETAGSMVVIVVVSLIMSLMVESPVIGLEKLLLSKRRSTAPTEPALSSTSPRQENNINDIHSKTDANPTILRVTS